MSISGHHHDAGPAQVLARVRGRVAASVAEAVWLSGTTRDPVTYRLFQAWVVDQLEPGRVAAVLANGHRA